MSSNVDIKSLMAKYFLNCPICKSEANFSAENEKKLKVQCNHCGVIWQLFLSINADNIISLKLIRSDKERIAKSIKNIHEVLGFWQHPDFLEINPSLLKEVEKNFKLHFDAFSDKKKEIALHRLIELGDLAVFHLLAITINTVHSLPGYAYWSKSLDVVGKIANPICLPDLVRIYHCGYTWINKQVVIHTILKILPNTDEKLQYKEFLKEVWQTDVDRSVRGLAMHGLRDLNLIRDTEFNKFIPEMLKRIEQDEDPQSRITSIIGLGEFINHPQVINFLLKSLSDNATPSSDPIMAGSLTGFLVAAAKSKPKASVGEVAANMLLKSGNKTGIIGLIDFILDGGLGRKIHDEKIDEILSVGPYVVEYIEEKLHSDVGIQRSMAHEFLSRSKRK